MRRLGARLGSLLIGGLGVLIASSAMGAVPRSGAVVAANAYGDTVWFDSEEMTVGPPVAYVGIHGGVSPAPTTTHTAAWGRTRGTPILIQLPERDYSPSTHAIVEFALKFPRLGLGHTDPPNEWNITTRESSHFDNYEGRRLESWSVEFPREDTSDVRLVFVVIGISDSTVAAPLRQSWTEPWGRSRSPGDPMPLRADEHARACEIPVADRLMTARIVGEFRADLKHRRIELVPQPPATASSLAGRWHYGPCTLTR